MGFREAWFEWQMAGQQFSKGYEVALSFLVCSLLSAAAWLYVLRRGDSGAVPSGKPAIITIVLLVVTSAIGLPASFIALLSSLGAARSSWVDWGMVPVFVLVVSLAAGELKGRKAALVNAGVLVAMLGCMLIAMSLGGQAGATGGGRVTPWPLAGSRSGSLAIGVAAAVISAFCGALILQLVKKLRSAGLQTSLVLVLKLLPLGPLCLLAAYLLRNDDWSISPSMLGIAALNAVLMFVPLFTLYILLNRETVARVAPYLFLIPVFVSLLSLGFFHTREASSVPGMEWFGMALILPGLAWQEFGPALLAARRSAVASRVGQRRVA
jgi:drug/metabolite transporter (DMT)-like permease